MAQVSEKVKSIILFTRITEVQSYKNAKLEDIKYSTYGIEFFEKNVPIHRCNIGEEIKWEEVKKVP